MVIGYTSLEPHEVQDVVQQLGYDFRGNSYHLLERNCESLLLCVVNILQWQVLAESAWL